MDSIGLIMALIKGMSHGEGKDGKSAYAYAVEGGYTGTEAEFAAKLAQEKYANPEALTFTGAATGSYDGSQPITVNIPSGGGAEASETWEQIATAEISAPVRGLSINQDSDGNPFLLKKWRLTGTVTGYSNTETAAAVQASVTVTQDDDSTVQAYAIFRPGKTTSNNAFSVGADDGMIYSICNSGTSQNVLSARLYGITTKVFLPIKGITINGISASNLYVGSFTLYGVRG